MPFWSFLLAVSFWFFPSHSSTSSIALLSDPRLNQLRQCALHGLNISIAEQSCDNDDCICEQEYLPPMVSAVSTAVRHQCPGLDTVDAFSAMAAVISYCTDHGYSVDEVIATITTSKANTQTLSLLSSPEFAELPMCAMYPMAYACASIGCNTNNCFCRSDLMSSVLERVSVDASSACTGVATAGVKSALVAILVYCSHVGFAAQTASRHRPTESAGSESTATSFATSSCSILPGPSSSFPTNTELDVAATTTLASTPSSSSHPNNLQIILPVIIGVGVILIGILTIISGRRPYNQSPGNFQVPISVANTPGRVDSPSFPVRFLTGARVWAPWATFTNVVRDQYNQPRPSSVTVDENNIES